MKIIRKLGYYKAESNTLTAYAKDIKDLLELTQ